MSHNRKEIEYETNENGCHICISHYKNSWGYPMAHRAGRTQEIHRYLFKLQYGEIPKDMVVRHKCDNASCINVDHLELGTHKENMKDMVDRNRSAKGERNGRAKITEEDVRAIREDSRNNSELARAYNLHHSMISAIRLRKNWKHVV